MAQVASCPQCNHDLLVPNEMDPQSWAKCPECRSFFQVNQAVHRDVPTLLPVEPPSQDAQVAISAVDSPSSSAESDIGHDVPEMFPVEVDAGQTIDQPQSNDNLTAAAERIDEWFRSAKTLPDSPPIVTNGPEPDAVPDLGSFGDISSESQASKPANIATWDDPRHMESLLADVEARPADKSNAASETIAPDEHPGYADTIAATTTADVPMFAKSTNGKARRKRSPVRTLAITAIAGVVGLALGYYALLWLRGPTGDFLNLARYLPQVILPAELQAHPGQLEAVAPATADVAAEPPMSARESPAETTVSPAEVQAAHTTTDEPPAKSQPVDDRYGSETATAESPAEEPATLDVPAAAPLADDSATADSAGVTNAPSFTADELAAALQAAKEAQPSLVAGKLDDGREVQRAKGYSYSLMADLAQKATFVDPSSASESVATSQQAADELFRQTLSNAHTRSEVALILPKWIGSPHRKHGGVFFAASLTNPQNAGSVIECNASLETGQSSFTILVPATLADRLGDSSRPLGIVGWIVDKPAEHVTGYTGQAPQAVWATTLIPLE
ncbi:MAG: hypothetical protein WD738_10540 [Pirellulales bacterium]